VSLTGAGYEVCVKLERASKVAAFCRELGDTALADLARQESMEPVFRRAEESLRAGRAGPELEADLDALNAMVLRVEGEGMYPPVTRTAYPGQLPGFGAGSGAQVWTCPRGWCAGRGRVKPGQGQQSCKAAGELLAARPLP
jgi:hypothetical protein